MDLKEMTKYRELPDEIGLIRSEVLDCLVDGLEFLKSDAAVPAQRLANRILANIIIEHLDISGFNIHRKPSPHDMTSAVDARYFMSTL